jgi:quercetin dioxygenase-like cupin family protein
MPIMRQRLTVVLLVLAISVVSWIGLANSSHGQDQATPHAGHAATPAAASVVREALVSGMPEAAPGLELQLVRYTIQPGTTLAMHTHPGMQIAWIAEGILTYTVVEGGEIPIWRAAFEGNPEPPEMLAPGQTTELYPGDSVVETEGVVHFGANLGDKVVVIWASTLLTEGEPPAIVWEPGTPVASD